MVARVRAIDAGEDGQDMRLEGTNSEFGGIAWECGGTSWYVAFHFVLMVCL